MAQPVAGLIGHRQVTINFASPWRKEGDIAGWLSRSAWSLAVICQLRRAYNAGEIIRVWIPDYFCNTSLTPLRRTGAKLLFYPLTNNLMPDFDACQTMMRNDPPDLFVLVHYFGQSCFNEACIDFCVRNGAWLIEDAAHVLFPVRAIGVFGDFVLYSPHKHLPIPDGALLLARREGPAKLAGEKKFELLFHEIIHSFQNNSGFSHIPSVLWLFKRLCQMIGIRQWFKLGTPCFSDDNEPPNKFLHPRMSPMARRILPGLSQTLNRVARLRGNNKKQWDIVLARALKMKTSGLKKFNCNGIPYLAVFPFESETQAESAYLQWQKMGLPVTTWPDLPPEVRSNPANHESAITYRKTCIFLPVHQTICLRRIKG